MVDIAALRAKLNELKTGKRPGNQEFLKKFYNPPNYDESNKARSIVRILPGTENSETGAVDSFFIETQLHKLNGKNVHCPKKINRPCPICDYIRALWATEQDDKIAEAREIKAKKRFYMNVIARERIVQNETTGKEEIVKNDGPLIYSCGVKVFERILRDMVKDKIGDITNLQTGFDFRIEKEMQLSGYPGYDSSESEDETSVAGTKKEMEEWMNNLNDLNSLVNFKDHEELIYELNLHRGIDMTEGPTVQETVSTATSSPVAEIAIETETTVEEDTENEDDFLKQLEKIRESAGK